MSDTAVEARYEIDITDMECPRPDGSIMLMRVARPKGPGPFPAVVDVHGGAWILHDRNFNARIDDALAASGIVVAAPEFRKPPEGAYPVSIADNHLAIRWLKQNAQAFGSRADLVGGLGTSSGGHQLMLCALRPSDPRYAALALSGASGIDATLRFAIACWSVLDPLTRYHNAKRNQQQNLLAGHAGYWNNDEAAMADGNPQLILERDEHTSLPPLLIVQGTKDDNLTPDMADRFAQAYRAAGGDVTLREFEGQQHAFVTRAPDGPDSQAAIRVMIDYIKGRSGLR
jgi:acetyl esterase